MVTGCGHMGLASTVEYTSSVLYERCTPEKKAQNMYAEKVTVLASQLPHYN